MSLGFFIFRYASRPYYYMPVNRQGLADFFTLGKHLDPHRPSVNSTNGISDGIEFRLAETYVDNIIPDIL